MLEFTVTTDIALIIRPMNAAPYVVWIESMPMVECYKTSWGRSPRINPSKITATLLYLYMQVRV